MSIPPIPNRDDYINPRRNLLTMAFGNESRIDSARLDRSSRETLALTGRSGWLEERLIGLERKTGEWDVLKFKFHEDVSMAGNGDVFTVDNSLSPLASGISKTDAQKLIQEHNESVMSRKQNPAQYNRV